jgi:hypothetical protein
MGRWCSADPVLDLGGYDLYQFNLNNPLKNVDYEGLQGESIYEAQYADEVSQNRFSQSASKEPQKESRRYFLVMSKRAHRQYYWNNPGAFEKARKSAHIPRKMKKPAAIKLLAERNYAAWKLHFEKYHKGKGERLIVWTKLSEALSEIESDLRVASETDTVISIATHATKSLIWVGKGEGRWLNALEFEAFAKKHRTVFRMLQIKDPTGTDNIIEGCNLGKAEALLRKIGSATGEGSITKSAKRKVTLDLETGDLYFKVKGKRINFHSDQAQSLIQGYESESDMDVGVPDVELSPRKGDYEIRPNTPE